MAEESEQHEQSDLDTTTPFEAMTCPNCKHTVYEAYDEYDHCGSYCAGKGANIECWGCRESQPNQLAHMDYGGCLYQGSESEEEKEEKK